MVMLVVSTAIASILTAMFIIVGFLRITTLVKNWDWPNIFLTFIVLVFITIMLWGMWFIINQQVLFPPPAKVSQAAQNQALLELLAMPEDETDQEAQTPPQPSEMLPAPKIKAASPWADFRIGGTTYYFCYLWVDEHLTLQETSDLSGSVSYVPAKISAELERDAKVQAETAEALKPQQ